MKKLIPSLGEKQKIEKLIAAAKNYIVTKVSRGY